MFSSTNTTHTNATGVPPSAQPTVTTTRSDSTPFSGGVYANGHLNRQARRHVDAGDTRTGPRLRRTRSTLTPTQHERLVLKLKEQQQASAQALDAAQESQQQPPPSKSNAQPPAYTQPLTWIEAYGQALRAEGFEFLASDALHLRAFHPSQDLLVWVVIEGFEDAALHRSFANWVADHLELHGLVDFHVQRPLDPPQGGRLTLADLGYSSGRLVEFWRAPRARVEALAMRILRASPYNQATQAYTRHGGIASLAVDDLLKTLPSSALELMGSLHHAYQNALVELQRSEASDRFVADAIEFTGQGLHYVVVPARFMTRALRQINWNVQAVLRIDPHEQTHGPRPRPAYATIKATDGKLPVDLSHDRLEL